MRKGWALALLLLLSATAIEAMERVYDREPSWQDRSDVHYVVNNLAERKWYWLLAHMGEMKRAGDRIEPLHPLRFLQVVFTDEKLKSSIRNISSKGGRFWNELMGGLKRSLSEEQGKGNITTKQVNEFAKAVGIEPLLISGAITASRWDDFVALLIQHVPNQNDGNRIDW